jgi:colanic acid/amylovoran biosynthesis glycosyltransferase
MDIWILTGSYPFGSGEQFLETEVEYWGKVSGAQINLIPSRAVGTARSVPAGISVDLCLGRSSRIMKLCSLVPALFSPFFIRELFWLKQKQMLSAYNVYTAWRTAAAVLHKYRYLKRKLKEASDFIIIYSYWFDTVAYAAALLRRKGQVDRLFTRAHGGDVYEERRKNNYMPLRRQFAIDFDTVFAVSEKGCSYLQCQYSIPSDRLELARLGVVAENRPGSPSPPGNLNILSVSFCVSVKRIDRIIDALALVAQRAGQDLSINWTHIGDGILKQNLQERAAQALNQFENVTFQFLGHLPNHKVLQYLETQPTDVFINSSESEGVPVSVMEAMSYGVPVMAPSVGGIPEIVNIKNGKLLSNEPSISEIAKALLAFEHFKKEDTREAARETIKLHYNAAKNYSGFVQNILLTKKL